MISRYTIGVQTSDTIDTDFIIFYKTFTKSIYIFKTGFIAPPYQNITINIKFKNTINLSNNSIKLFVDKYSNDTNLDIEQNEFFNIPIFQTQNIFFSNHGNIMSLVHPIYLLISNQKLKNIKLYIKADNYSHLYPYQNQIYYFKTR